MENKINIARFKEGSRTAEIKGIWQWDYGQILRIQGLNLPTAVEIHFSLDEHGGEAVRRIGVTKDGVTDVPIPDSMVENESAYGDSYYFFAYIYLTDETSGNTEYKIRAKVSTRSKPEGYNSGDSTFAEILKTVNEIASDKVDIPAPAKVGQVLSVKATDESGKPTEFEATDQGGGVSDEKIAEAVGTYMEAHPIDETDPTVPDWAKQPKKPSYTAEEVGALPNTTTTLPNPNALTFTGAATGSYDGSSPIEINIPEGGGTGVTVDTTLSVAGQAADAKTTGDAISSLSEEIANLTGTGLSTEAIDKLEEVGNYLVYTTANGGSKWTELIAILRNGSSGGGSGETVPATGISLDKTTLSFTTSATQNLTATVEPLNSTDKVTWESSNTVIATVSGGVVTPVSNGSCTITAKVGNYSASCEVTVAVESEIVTYTITNNLTNVSTDNPVTTITENRGYTANLTADTGYTIDTVTVTMGDVDVTSDVYTNSAIFISAVTGNVVINASAVHAGEIEEEIILLKSITGDGNSYIDTEFIPTDGVKYQIALQLNSDIDTTVNQYLWGADQYTSNDSGAYHQLLMYTQNSDYAKYGSWLFLDRGSYPQFILLGQSTDFTTQPGYFQCMSNENTISQQLYIDEDYTTAPPQGQWDKSVTYTGNKVYPIIPIYLFWVNRASGAFANESRYTKQKYTLYHFRIYDIATDSLLHEFLPAKQGTKIGVYDTVTQKFHENKGTGTFGYEEVSA